MADPRPVFWNREVATGLPLMSVAGLISTALGTLFVCTCGFMGWLSLPLTLTGTAMAWSDGCRKDLSRPYHYVALVVVVFTSAVAIRNIVDVIRH